MQKRKWLLFAIGIVLIVFSLRQLIFLNMRHHLLCEVLKPDMSESEVIHALGQEGEFTMNREEWGLGGDSVLRINFTDVKARDRYGYFSVLFFDYKYGRAVVSHGSNKPEIICDFYQPTQSGEGTPKS